MSMKQNLEAVLKRLSSELDEQQINRIREKLTETLDYKPKIGVFGKTGAGKSSLCNGLFGQDLCKVSDIQACTRNTQEVLLGMGNDKGMVLVDVPGVGENLERDAEYEALYKSLLPEMDLVIWVLKGDDRAYSVDIEFYEKMVKPYMDKGKPFLIVLNQVDKIEPFREWDETNSRPGPKQQDNITRKVRDVSNCFHLPVSQISAVSAVEGYGLVDLVDNMVFTLPDRRLRITVTEQVPVENRSAKVQETVKKDWLETVVDAVVNVASKAVSWVADKVSSFFSWW